MGRYVVGISGASGIILAKKAAEMLVYLGHFVELVISKDALYTASLELGPRYSTPKRFMENFQGDASKVTLHNIQDVGAKIASGSYPVQGMLVIPCSMATLAAISTGLADNCLRRAADVTLKERRKLVIVPRETPLSEIHLEHMLRLTRLGAIMVPPVPAWYTHPKSMEEMESFIVGKAVEMLGISNVTYPRWEGVSPEEVQTHFALKSDERMDADAR